MCKQITWMRVGIRGGKMSGKKKSTIARTAIVQQWWLPHPCPAMRSIVTRVCLVGQENLLSLFSIARTERSAYFTGEIFGRRQVSPVTPPRTYHKPSLHQVDATDEFVGLFVFLFSFINRFFSVTFWRWKCTGRLRLRIRVRIFQGRFFGRCAKVAKAQEESVGTFRQICTCRISLISLLLLLWTRDGN